MSDYIDIGFIVPTSNYKVIIIGKSNFSLRFVISAVGYVMPDKICSHSRETCLQLQLKLIADTWGGAVLRGGGVKVKSFALTGGGGFSDVHLY